MYIKMSDAFIGRQSAIWLWIETTRWTKVAPQVRIPKTTGVLSPTTESVNDDSWYGVIDEVYDSFTTKNFSWLSLEWIVRDDFIWYLLKLAMWSYQKLNVFTWTPTWWTPARWDSVQDWVLRKILKIGETTYYCFDWTVSAWTITNWTWTMTATAVSDFNVHLFSRENSNVHPSATIYDKDPVASSYAPFCMLNTFEISCEVADYMKFSAEFQWKQMQAETWTLTPAYDNEPGFVSSMAWVRFADNEAWLNDATEVCMQNFRVAINKNLTDIQCFGSTDVEALYNQQFGVEWDFEALYDSTTLRDMALNSSKQALRLYAENSTEWSFSAIYVDLFKVWLNEWTKTDNNNELTKQTMWFVWQYSNDDSASIEIVLINWNSEWY